MSEERGLVGQQEPEGLKSRVEMMKSMKLKVALLTATAAYSGSSFAAMSNAELETLVKEQAERIDQLEEGQTVIADEVDTQSTLLQWASKTTLGGYGEVHYNNTETDADPAKEKDQLDVHRFVVYIAHQYSDTVRFFSEVELEHALSGGGDSASCTVPTDASGNVVAGDFECDVNGKPGEVELEQAYIEWDYSENHSLKSGVVLVPVGILNETHEPDTFYGVERNNVEKNIIPTTWWESGAFFTGEIAEGVTYDVAVHSGLNLDGSAKIRSGRQKVAEADASELAYTGRIKYTGVPGLEAAVTFQHQSDLEQGNASETVSANLFETHVIYSSGPFGIKALYAQWDIDESIETTSGTLGADEQEGFFIEPSFKVNEKLGVYARYSEWDNTAGSGSSADTATDQVDIGVNYWLTPNVVFKADYQNQSNDNDSKASDGFNLGVGWSF